MSDNSLDYDIEIKIRLSTFSVQTTFPHILFVLKSKFIINLTAFNVIIILRYSR